MAAEIKLSTTGTLNPVVISDFGERSFAHPTVDFNLLEEFFEDEIKSSEEVQGLIDAGHITIEDQNGVLITDLSAIGGVHASPSRNNKNMAVNVTNSDGDIATSTPITTTPHSDSHVHVTLNGLDAQVGDGVKTTDCYFSGDGGTNARNMTDISAGDFCYWNGSIIGYELVSVDRISFHYDE